MDIKHIKYLLTPVVNKMKNEWGLFDQFYELTSTKDLVKGG
jgi:hypothetical protein